MKKIICLIFAFLIIAANTVIIISFFKPWANIDASGVGVAEKVSSFAAKIPFAQRITEKLDTAITTIRGAGVDVKIKAVVTGYNIPILVNDKTSQVALSLTQILFKSAEGLNWKSYLVYLLPIFGIICAILAILGIKYNLAIFPMIAISSVISGFGIYNLKTIDISSEMVKITIEKGLWNTMYAFMSISLIGIIWLVITLAIKEK